MAKPECRTMNIGMMYQKSNEPTKTKKAMKTKKFLSMAALALVGAMMTGCSSDDDILQPENKTNVVTLTATVGFDSGTGTRALTAAGVKTFAEGDQMAVIYKNTSGGTVKAVGTLTSGAGTKSGTFTFTLTNPKYGDVTYIYPAAMAGTTGVDYSKLYSQSSGTLTDLGSKYDLATKSSTWKSGALPSLTLNNKLAILAINLKNSTDITSTITGMTISDGTYTYAVSRSAAAGPIYVAIRPTTDATINVTATDGTDEYVKTLTSKTYAANNGYNVTWNMTKQAPAARALSEATTDDIGKIAGADGYIYDNAAAAVEAGSTAAAMIAYVGSATQPTSSNINASMATYNHGLAIALTEVSNTSGAEGLAGMSWADAGTAAGAYTRARPSASSEWFLPSAYQWMWMLNGCGGGTPTTTLTNVAYSYGNFQTKMQNCGGTQMQSLGSYWSSTESVDNNNRVWRYTFNNGGMISTTGKGDNCMVRSAFAF